MPLTDTDINPGQHNNDQTILHNSGVTSRTANRPSIVVPNYTPFDRSADNTGETLYRETFQHCIRRHHTPDILPFGKPEFVCPHIVVLPINDRE